MERVGGFLQRRILTRGATLTAAANAVCCGQRDRCQVAKHVGILPGNFQVDDLEMPYLANQIYRLLFICDFKKFDMRFIQRLNFRDVDMPRQARFLIRHSGNMFSRGILIHFCWQLPVRMDLQIRRILGCMFSTDGNKIRIVVRFFSIGLTFPLRCSFIAWIKACIMGMHCSL